MCPPSPEAMLSRLILAGSQAVAWVSVHLGNRVGQTISRMWTGTLQRAFNNIHPLWQKGLNIYHIFLDFLVLTFCRCFFHCQLNFIYIFSPVLYYYFNYCKNFYKNFKNFILVLRILDILCYRNMYFVCICKLEISIFFLSPALKTWHLYFIIICKHSSFTYHLK